MMLLGIILRPIVAAINFYKYSTATGPHGINRELIFAVGASIGFVLCLLIAFAGSR